MPMVPRAGSLGKNVDLATTSNHGGLSGSFYPLSFILPRPDPTHISTVAIHTVVPADSVCATDLNNYDLFSKV